MKFLGNQRRTQRIELLGTQHISMFLAPGSIRYFSDNKLKLVWIAFLKTVVERNRIEPKPPVAQMGQQSNWPTGEIASLSRNLFPDGGSQIFVGVAQVVRSPKPRDRGTSGRPAPAAGEDFFQFFQSEINQAGSDTKAVFDRRVSSVSNPAFVDATFHGFAFEVSLICLQAAMALTTPSS